jgi:hypothetical protein
MIVAESSQMRGGSNDGMGFSTKTDPLGSSPPPLCTKWRNWFAFLHC